MNLYHVTLQAAINVHVSEVEAATPQEAILTALDRVDLYGLLKRRMPVPNVDFTEFAEELREALVDEAGDEEFEKSRWFLWNNGQWTPAPTNQQEEILLLDQQAGALREELGYSQPGEVIRQTRLDFDELLVVVADGYGRASLLRVSGNYPVEYYLKDRKDFDNERTACAEAGQRAAELHS